MKEAVMALTLRSACGSDAVTLRVRGRLDMNLAGAFWRISHPSQSAYRSYVVDLFQVEQVFDSGLALLLMLDRRARRHNGRVQIVNVPSKL